MQSFFDSDDDYFWPIWIEELYDDAGEKPPEDLDDSKYNWRFVEDDEQCEDFLHSIDNWEDWYSVIQCEKA
jgi:hypothetical protein